MKKQLLATTALVAASMLAAAGSADAQKAQAPKFEVKGYMEQTFGAAFGLEEGNPLIGNRTTFDQHNETEVHFIGSAALDNGITFRAVVELEGDGDGTPAPVTDVIDESYLTIRGAFGQLNLGNTDHAATLGTTGYMGSWATQVGQNLTFDTGDWIPAPAGMGLRSTPDGPLLSSALRGFGDDSNMITYFTPRFFGFQFGASYIPNAEQDLNTSISTTDNIYNNGYAFSLNFDQKFDQVGVGIAAGFLHWSAPDASSNPDAKAAGFGARFDFMGFRLAGAYKKQWDFRDSSGALGAGSSVLTSLDGSRWEVGLRYMFGPNAVSAVYGHGKQENLISNSNDAELDHMMVAYRRTLGPGVFWYMNFTWADFEGENSVSTSDDSSGYAISTGVRLNF